MQFETIEKEYRKKHETLAAKSAAMLADHSMGIGDLVVSYDGLYKITRYDFKGSILYVYGVRRLKKDGSFGTHEHCVVRPQPYKGGAWKTAR